jgi:hypothetical protein
MSTQGRVIGVVALAVVFAGSACADWADSFEGGQLNLPWTFVSFPQKTGTFQQTITAGADANDFYLTFTETTPEWAGGAVFALGFPSTEKFKDVRVGATVNVTGNDCHYFNYGLIARASYYVDPDGKRSGMGPGVIADGYIMHIDYSDGPANLSINVDKIMQNHSVLDEIAAAVVPGVLNARSFYAELEVVGASAATVTGRLYESQGGSLLAEVSFVDADATDLFEDGGPAAKVFPEGLCGIFAENRQLHGEPAGFTCSWDDVSAVSDFTLSPSLVIDDFESYGGDQIEAAWVDNIPGSNHALLTADRYQGFKGLCLEVQNQYEPYLTQATRTFAPPQDWTGGGAHALSLMFCGWYVDADKTGDLFHANVEQPLYVKVADEAGHEATATLPGYVILSASWRSWEIPLAEMTAAGVDVTKVQALTVGVGDGTPSAQPAQDVDLVFFDDIRLTVLP